MSILSCGSPIGGIAGLLVNANNIQFNAGTYYIEYSVIFSCNQPIQGGLNVGTTSETVMIDFNDQQSIIPGNGGAELATFENVSNYATGGLIVTGLTIAMTYTFGSTSTRYPRVYNLTGALMNFSQNPEQGSSCLMITKLS